MPSTTDRAFQSFSRRLNKDIDDLQACGYEIDVDVKVSSSEATIIHTSAVVGNVNLYYKIIVPPTFPFKPADVCVLQKDRRNTPNMSHYHLYKQLMHYYTAKLGSFAYYKCTCCRALTFRWSPQNRLSDLVAEANAFYVELVDIRSVYFGKRALGMLQYPLDAYLTDEIMSFCRNPGV